MSKPEDAIALILKRARVPFEREKTFTDLRNNKYRFDFYIPNYKGKEILLEYGNYKVKEIRTIFKDLWIKMGE